MKRLAATLAFAVAVFTCPAAGVQAQAPDAGDAEEIALQTVVSHGLAVSFVMPEGWYIVADRMDTFRIASSPVVSMFPLEATTVSVYRQPSAEGDTPEQALATMKAMLLQRGADVRDYNFSDDWQGIAVRERSEAISVTPDGEETTVLYRTTLLGARGDEVFAAVCTFPEGREPGAMIAAWVQLQRIVNSVSFLDQERSAPPVPEDAVRVGSVPYEEAFELEPGGCVTLVLPDGKSVSFWALRSTSIGGPVSASGLDLAWGERPFCQAQFEWREHADGTRSLVTAEGYIERGSVVTRGRESKSRELIVGDLSIVLTQDLAAEDVLPVTVTIVSLTSEVEAE